MSNINYSYDNIFDKIKNNSKVLDIRFDDTKVVSEKNISISSINIKENLNNYLRENSKYDTIIFNQLFTNLKEDKINIILEKLKDISFQHTKIFFINNIITNFNQYYYHPFSFLKIFGYPVYMENMYDNIREHDMNIINSDRANSYNLITYPIETFIIICNFKNF